MGATSPDWRVGVNMSTSNPIGTRMLSTLSPRSRRAVAVGCATVGIVALHGGAALFFSSHDPYSSTVFPPCPFLFFTGWQCPACGGTRAAYSLFQGDLAASWRMNPIVILGYPLGAVFAGAIAAHWAARPQLSTILVRTGLVALSAIAFYNVVIRNILAGLNP